MIKQSKFFESKLSGNYIYVKNNVVYKVSKELCDDGCEKYKFVDNPADSSLPQIDGLTYVAAPKFSSKLSWTDPAKGEQTSFDVLYCDKLVTPGWIVDKSGDTPIFTLTDHVELTTICNKEVPDMIQSVDSSNKPLFDIHTGEPVMEQKKDKDGKLLTKIVSVPLTPEEYVWHSYVDDIINDLINGIKLERIWVNLPNTLKYTTGNKVGNKTFTQLVFNHTPKNIGVVLNNSTGKLEFTEQFISYLKEAIVNKSKTYLVQLANKFDLEPTNVDINVSYN